MSIAASQPWQDPKELLTKGLENALALQQPLATANIERLRRVHPEKTPQELIRVLDHTFLTAVTVTGGGAGAAGAIPGLALGLTAGFADVLAFTESSVLYVLSVAEVHGFHADDIERRRLLVMAVLLGDTATGAVKAVAGKTGPHWARRIVRAIPIEAINRLNKVLGPRFITKYGTKQGVLVLSKQLPVGIGVVLGAGGNYLVGRGIITSARKIFGGSPAKWSADDGGADPSDAPEGGEL